MRRSLPLRFGLLLAVTLLAAPNAQAQITWSVTYQDAAGTGFNDTTTLSGETQTLGQLRQASVQAALNYMGGILDGRGSVSLQFKTSQFDGTGYLAQFGPGLMSAYPGSFQTSPVYQKAVTNQNPNSGPDGSGTFDFGYSYNYFGQKNPISGGSYDMTTIALHELTHGLGFLSFVNSTGSGLMGTGVGNPDTYSSYDRFLQLGTGAGATPLLNTNINSTGYGSFTGPVSALTSNNLYFNGKYAQEVFGGPVPLYAPSTYAQGSSVSHDSTSPAGVMNYSTGPNNNIRYQPYEIAMLLDIGWNTYNWNSSTGKWGDGISSVASSRWTSTAILSEGGNTYNVNGSASQAPILPVYGQTTSNIILNFGGSGTASYTSTNDIGQVRLARLNLNSSSTATNTITGGTLLFGQSSDGTSSVLVPKIVQDGTGAFNVGSGIVIPNGLTVDGAGAGVVTLTGVVSDLGALTKAGAFTLALANDNTYAGGTTVTGGTLQLGTGGTTGSVAGNIANNAALAFNRSNTYTYSGVISGTGSVSQTGTGVTVLTGNNTYSGPTTVAAGELRVSGQTGTNSGTGTGVVTVSSGATVGGNGQIGNGTSGSLAVQAGGSVRPGDPTTIAALTVNTAADTVLAGNSKLLVNVGTTTTASGQLQLLGAGLLDLTGLSPSKPLSLILTALQPLTSGQYTWNVIHLGGSGHILYPGAPVGAFDPSQFSITPSNFTADASQFSISGTTNDITVVYTPVPEPAWALLAAAPVVGLVALRRRRTAAPPTLAA